MEQGLPEIARMTALPWINTGGKGDFDACGFILNQYIPTSLNLPNSIQIFGTSYRVKIVVKIEQ